MKQNFTCQKGQRVMIKERSKTRFVEMDEITHLQCDGHLTTIHTINNESFTVSKLLKNFEEELLIFGFVRVNRATIINMLYVAQYIGGCKRVVKFLNNIEISISRRKVFYFRKK